MWTWSDPFNGGIGPVGPAGPAGPGGAPGAAGATILSGVVAPTVEGVDGDFYIDTVTDMFYGPKAGGVWPAGVDLDGAAGAPGSTVLNGVVAPTVEGVDGDFYLDTVTSTMYGPKAGGVWPAGVVLVGPVGPAGVGTVSTITEQYAAYRKGSNFALNDPISIDGAAYLAGTAFAIGVDLAASLVNAAVALDAILPALGFRATVAPIGGVDNLILSRPWSAVGVPLLSGITAGLDDAWNVGNLRNGGDVGGAAVKIGMSINVITAQDIINGQLAILVGPESTWNGGDQVSIIGITVNDVHGVPQSSAGYLPGGPFSRTLDGVPYVWCFLDISIGAAAGDKVVVVFASM